MRLGKLTRLTNNSCDVNFNMVNIGYQDITRELSWNHPLTTVMSGKVLRNATWTGIRVATAFTFLFVFPQLMVGYIHCRCGSHNILDLRVYTDRIEWYYYKLFGSCFFEIFDWKSPDLLWHVVKQPYGKHWEAVLCSFFVLSSLF